MRFENQCPWLRLAFHSQLPGHKVVVGACDLFAQDYRHRRGGLPDLVLWRVDGGWADVPGRVAVPLRKAAQLRRALTRLISSPCPEHGRRVSRFLEVKSPNDRLADKQRIWLHVLHHLGADVGVCNVTTSGARSAGGGGEDAD